MFRSTLLALGLSGADSSSPWALYLESSLTGLALSLLAAALPTVGHWPCPGAHPRKGKTGEPPCQQPLVQAQVDSYLAG